MARKARQRISYVLPLANSPGGHRLGVNGLAVDAERSILYSGGRDGVICAWDLHFNVKNGPRASEDPFFSPEDPPKIQASGSAPGSTFRSSVQAHTHWVNDILLVQSNSALVSASSDITVKLWRPHSQDSQSSSTIGLHSDYVKCVASPGPQSDWVVSGGLDHKIRVWDLNGGGEKLKIDAGEDENSAKGSVYALSVRGSIMASGGPESVVRMWDPRSGKRITKFVGHTDNVRDILINEHGDTIMTASSDQTVKVWSMTAGRCMYTLTMHNDSVWSLYSDHPDLSIFYSSDRSGIVAKTDVRGCTEMDEGLSLALVQEQGGVSKVIVAGDYLWTATSSSSINRWKDVDTTMEIQLPDFSKQQRSPTTTSQKGSSPLSEREKTQVNGNMPNKIPASCILQMSNTASLARSKGRDSEVAMAYPSVNARKQSEPFPDPSFETLVPFHSLPEETVEGQNGLIKHLMLNDRKRVLTLDTAGDVMMWDLLKASCVPIQSFGKRHLEDVVPEVNTMEAVAAWCGVDTRTGRLSCILELNNCFDAEMYADELGIEDQDQFRDDQRNLKSTTVIDQDLIVNLGKWVLRHLFANLIDEEIRKDEVYRADLRNSQHPLGLHRDSAPSSIQLPTPSRSSQDDSDALITPRPPNGHVYPAMTPGLSIGVATPGGNHQSPATNNLPSTAEEGTDSKVEKVLSNQSHVRTSTEKSSGDYFSSTPQPPVPPIDTTSKEPKTPGVEQAPDAQVTSPTDADKDDKPKEVSSGGGTIFGKKFRMNFPKKLGRSSIETTNKQTAVDIERPEESDKSSDKEDSNNRIVEDNFYGIIQKIRNEYEDRLHENQSSEPLASGINPSLPSETPLLNPPPLTSIIIQEDRPDSGGVADLYRGTVESAGRDADSIEKAGPMWLGDLLLRNQIPFKDTVKVSFVLLPYQDLLPSIASSDGNSRLNANRMLRARKILGYVAERIEPPSDPPDLNALKPEEYLDLYCQNQLVPETTTLATLRAHIWKTGGDVVLYYKSNGRNISLDQKVARERERRVENNGNNGEALGLGTAS